MVRPEFQNEFAGLGQGIQSAGQAIGNFLQQQTLVRSQQDSLLLQQKQPYLDAIRETRLAGVTDEQDDMLQRLQDELLSVTTPEGLQGWQTQYRNVGLQPGRQPTLAGVFGEVEETSPEQVIGGIANLQSYLRSGFADVNTELNQLSAEDYSRLDQETIERANYFASLTPDQYTPDLLRQAWQFTNAAKAQAGRGPIDTGMYGILSGWASRGLTDDDKSAQLSAILTPEEMRQLFSISGMQARFLEDPTSVSEEELNAAFDLYIKANAAVGLGDLADNLSEPAIRLSSTINDLLRNPGAKSFQNVLQNDLDVVNRFLTGQASVQDFTKSQVSVANVAERVGSRENAREILRNTVDVITERWDEGTSSDKKLSDINYLREAGVLSELDPEEVDQLLTLAGHEDLTAVNANDLENALRIAGALTRVQDEGALELLNYPAVATAFRERNNIAADDADGFNAAVDEIQRRINTQQANAARTAALELQNLEVNTRENVTSYIVDNFTSDQIRALINNPGRNPSVGAALQVTNLSVDDLKNLLLRVESNERIARLQDPAAIQAFKEIDNVIEAPLQLDEDVTVRLERVENLLIEAGYGPDTEVHKAKRFYAAQMIGQAFTDVEAASARAALDLALAQAGFLSFEDVDEYGNIAVSIGRHNAALRDTMNANFCPSGFIQGMTTAAADVRDDCDAWAAQITSNEPLIQNALDEEVIVRGLQRLFEPTEDGDPPVDTTGLEPDQIVALFNEVPVDYAQTGDIGALIDRLNMMAEALRVGFAEVNDAGKITINGVEINEFEAASRQAALEEGTEMISDLPFPIESATGGSVLTGAANLLSNDNLLSEAQNSEYFQRWVAANNKIRELLRKGNDLTAQERRDLGRARTRRSMAARQLNEAYPSFVLTELYASVGGQGENIGGGGGGGRGGITMQEYPTGLNPTDASVPEARGDNFLMRFGEGLSGFAQTFTRLTREGVKAAARAPRGLDFLRPTQTTEQLMEDGLPSTVATPVRNVFAGLIQQESNGQHRNPVTGELTNSVAGAVGITQLMPETAVQPGFGVKELVPFDSMSEDDQKLVREKRVERDEANDNENYAEARRLQNEINAVIRPYIDDVPEAEYVRFGAEYLDAMYRRYNNNIELALAAYNGGPGRVDRALRAWRAGMRRSVRTQGDNLLVGGNDRSFWSYLPAETRNYVPAILERVR